MLKRVLIGLLLFILLGVLGAFGVIAFQIFILKMDDSIEMSKIMLSDEFRYWAFLFTLLSMVLSTWIATRRLDKKIFLTSIIFIGSCSWAAHLVYQMFISIHSNYLAIVIGGGLGAAISYELNKPMQITAKASAD